MLLFAPLALAHSVYVDRSGLPDVDRILRFEAPAIGTVYDARGEVLIEVAREYRRTVPYDEFPKILRDAILSAEDKNFFSHSGLDYSALPRVLWKAAQSSLAVWRSGGPGGRLRLPQGGSTLTQQLVRGYFLQDWVRAEQSDVLYRDGVVPRLVSLALGARATNKLARKLEETGLARYEKRRPKGKGLIQGSVVVMRNADAAILAEAGSRRLYKGRLTAYSDFNRVTDSARQPGSAMKPLAYLAAFGLGMDLDTTVPDEPIGLSTGAGREVKWIANYDGQFKGPMPLREALAESRNAAAVWVARESGLYRVMQTARAVGIRSPLQPHLTTALGASEVRLLELADAYRAMASELLAEPHVIDRVTGAGGGVVYEAPRSGRDIRSAGFTSEQLRLIQEGLRGVVRLPDGTAHSLAGRDFPIPVIGKTGTTSEYRDALFVGSTYGPSGITVAVRIGYDDNRELPPGARAWGTSPCGRSSGERGRRRRRRACRRKRACRR
jgi:membrane peptidoglycan carboxypeptidase